MSPHARDRKRKSAADEPRAGALSRHHVRSLLRAHGQREPAPPYPILDISEAPEAVETVLINHPELPPYGAGETAIRAVPAAIANATLTPPACAYAARPSRRNG
jgi:hypothetical protein